MTTEQKAKAFDNICSRIDVSCGRGSDKKDAKDALEGILHYTLGIYASCTMSGDEILQERDTEYDEDGCIYENPTRGLLCPIQDSTWMYGYKDGKKILEPKTD